MKSLAPEHLADVRRSGLSDSSIAACELESVSPGDLKLKGVESAYRIPYFNLDGTRNCAERWKLVPPLRRADGTQKYHQEAGTAPSLYLAPLINWVPIASDPQQPIIITEGEKKAASACQHGIPTIGVAGVWSWRQKLDTGERLVLPALDQIVWTGRPVEMIPDSDVWKRDKLPALCGFYALGQELASRGARVKFVVLPEAGQGKIWLDDWFVRSGPQYQHYWPNLERLGIDDAALVKPAAWWQGWRERHATQEALRVHVADELSVTEVAGLFTVKSPTHGVTFMFDRLSTSGGRVVAEVSISVGGTELRSSIDLNLKNATAQATLARNLSELSDKVPWKILIPRSCSLVLKRYREGAPVLRLDKDARAEPQTYVVNPLVSRRKVTVLYGLGGGGKSTKAIATATIVSTGGSIAGISAVKGRSLYLDWEDSEDVHLRRLHALQKGHPELAEGHVLYRRCTERLARTVQELARLIQREQITYLVIDSLLAAAGGGSDAEATQEFFAALRVLDVATLVIGHTPKTIPDGQETATIYGSVFNSNFARSVWELQTTQEVGEDGSTLALVHRKSNLSRLHPPIGLTVRQAPDGSMIRYEACDLNRVAALAKALPLPAQIRNLLEDGVLRTSKQVADELGAKLATVKATLSKHRGRKWCLVGNHGDQEAKWTTLHS
jgi:hypothetical protein